MHTTLKQCPTCQTPFTPTTNQIFCGPQCRKLAPISCIKCTKTFTPNQTRNANSKQVVCCIACNSTPTHICISLASLNTLAYMDQRTCLTCGTPFKPRRFDQRTCKHTCHHPTPIYIDIADTDTNHLLQEVHSIYTGRLGYTFTHNNHRNTQIIKRFNTHWSTQDPANIALRLSRTAWALRLH